MNSPNFRPAKPRFSAYDLPGTTSDDSPAIACAISRDLSDPVSVPGHQTPFYNDSDDDVAERLAISGIEEAWHDQTIAARRRKHS